MPTHVHTAEATLVGEHALTNIRDAAIDKSKARHDAVKASPFIENVKHNQKMSRRYGDMQTANNNEKQRLATELGDAKFQRDQIVRSFEDAGKALPASATAEVDATIANMQAEQRERSEEKFPSPEYFENMMRQLARFNNGKWKLLSTTYHVGDKRPSNEIRKACAAITKAAGRKLEFEYTRPRHEDDAIQDGIADLRRRAKRGEPSVAMLLLGFTIDPRTGAYRPNRDAEVEFPAVMSRDSEFHTSVPVDDALDTAICVNCEAYEKKITELIKAKASPNAIRDKDRPAAIAKAKAELLAAQHAEEAANRMCEREGLMVFRPSDWPVEVLLGAEPDTSPKPVKAPTPVEEPDFEEAATE